MEYKIVVVKAVGFLGTSFEAAAEKLAEEVGQLIALGWEPHGGVSLGQSRSFKTPYLFQAMTRRR
jgi:hypothetical protein